MKLIGSRIQHSLPKERRAPSKRDEEGVRAPVMSLLYRTRNPEGTDEDVNIHQALNSKRRNRRGMRHESEAPVGFESAKERVGRPGNMKVLSKQTFFTITVQILFDVKDEGGFGGEGGRLAWPRGFESLWLELTIKLIYVNASGCDIAMLANLAWRMNDASKQRHWKSMWSSRVRVSQKTPNRAWQKNQHVRALLLARKRFIKCEPCLWGGGRGGGREETAGLMMEPECVKDVESWAKGVVSIPQGKRKAWGRRWSTSFNVNQRAEISPTLFLSPFSLSLSFTHRTNPKKKKKHKPWKIDNPLSTVMAASR